MHITHNTAIALRSQLQAHIVLRERLLKEMPLLDSQTLADTLEGLTDLREMLAEVIRSALEDEALAAGLSTRLAEMIDISICSSSMPSPPTQFQCTC